ncbi:Uma2 family endonuclease [Waterburya agarophytonicola K14]|uniref:Uma2 family endonuclease n=1 Tax=Waterburya agarophytonicola KI4 TaxID=2874699 RepID=A0A964BPK8_9CYAN|nr:Uma2 family endonuclease [Waterburya agarophytonicola]MCC0175580.1 Uma2 family endonuclease [Waterburya agarophytonicola KI4]
MTAISKKSLFSFEEYLEYDPDPDNRYELVAGQPEIMNPPTFRHILICDFVRDIFKTEINRLQLPWLAIREGGIRTGWRKSRITDVCVVEKAEVLDSLDKSGVLENPPLLVVQVVLKDTASHISPESIKRDYRYKRSEYAALGIPEYWIIDPIEQKVTILVLDEGLYEETLFTAAQELISSTFQEIKITPQQLFTIKT